MLLCNHSFPHPSSQQQLSLPGEEQSWKTALILEYSACLPDRFMWPLHVCVIINTVKAPIGVRWPAGGIWCLLLLLVYCGDLLGSREAVWLKIKKCRKHKERNSSKCRAEVGRRTSVTQLTGSSSASSQTSIKIKTPQCTTCMTTCDSSAPPFKSQKVAAAQVTAGWKRC